MKTTLSKKELVFIASMLFGLFFGAGNLIFPIYMGQMAGRHMWQATIGFLIAGVGLPLLGVAAMGISRSNGLIELSGKVSRGYSVFFTCALYLTIGPFFAIPRCATVPFTVGVTPLLGTGVASGAALAIFSGVFFLIVLGFSLFPGKILTWVGKILNPLFLLFLGVLVVAALVNPIGEISSIAPDGSYVDKAFSTGFLEGYNTMDALASLAFGIIVIDAIRGLGIQEPKAVAKNTIKAGVFSCLLMALIYLAVTVVGAQSRGLYRDLQQRRRGLRPGVEPLLWQDRRDDPGSHGLPGLPENGRRPRHELRGDVLQALPEIPAVPRLGSGLQRRLLPDRQSGAGYDHCVFAARPDVPVSAGHHADPAWPVRQCLRP